MTEWKIYEELLSGGWRLDSIRYFPSDMTKREVLKSLSWSIRNPIVEIVENAEEEEEEEEEEESTNETSGGGYHSDCEDRGSWLFGGSSGFESC